jgi:hypothetical protein
MNKLEKYISDLQLPLGLNIKKYNNDYEDIDFDNIFEEQIIDDKLYDKLLLNMKPLYNIVKKNISRKSKKSKKSKKHYTKKKLT